MADSRQETPSEESTAASPQDLVEDVLREAQALLGGDSAPDEGARTPSTEEPVADSPTVDVQGLVDRVDSLLGDLGHLVADVETAERQGSTPGLDLTLILPSEAPDPKDVVPEHGPAGPQVDLFAVPAPAPASDSDPEPADTSDTPASVVLLETESASPSPSDATPEARSESPTSTAASILDDLSAALADEFDDPELTAPPMESTVTPSESASDVAAAEAELLAAMSVEFGIEPTDLPPIEDEGDPFESSAAPASEPSDAARRLEALLAKRLAEEYGLVDPKESGLPTMLESEADATEPARSDIDAVTRAEMEALEALGHDLGVESATSGESTARVARDDTTVADTPLGSTESPTVVESEMAAETESTPTPPVAEVVETVVATGADETEDTDESASADAETPIDEAESERPVARRVGPSVLVRIGAAPFRYLPRRMHRQATPVALSLLAWVPLVWGYALFAPTPALPSLDVLRAGLESEPATVPSEATHGDEVDSHPAESTADHTASDEASPASTGHAPASGASHDAGHH